VRVGQSGADLAVDMPGRQTELHSSQSNAKREQCSGRRDLVSTQKTELRRFEVESLKVEVYSTRAEAGAAAARSVAEELTRLAQNNGTIGVIFATGASQLETLRALRDKPGLPWGKVQGFHMDEYVGIALDHPASFRRYMRLNLTDHVSMRSFREVNGNVLDLDLECRQYAIELHAANPQLCLLGIGENGHLAFNDPGVANFDDPVDVKIVELDQDCKQQQAAEGWFSTPENVPERAITLTIPALLRVPKLIVSVPGPRKANIIRRTLREEISMACPATILRRHPNATVFLDSESASQLHDAGFGI
jgi:glucosamine-6-phosphate deaminase